MPVRLDYTTEGKNWALLVAGSNTYDNYRHQADICHAYHVVRNHGIPEENIVVMMYDDIAYSRENPYQGNVINEPNGENLYPGVVIDYKKEEVNPEVFLAVLTGNSSGIRELLGREGKVIVSGSDDHVFVNFADHGAPGLLAFPEDVLHAKPLEKAIKSMHKNKQFKKMVFYVEACESGSMFDGLLPEHISVFVTTAANPDESSYACYFDDERQTYLGDVYSVNWMQDSDKEDLSEETLQKQFTITKQETNTSHVMEYGDKTISKMTVAEFQGNEKCDKCGRSPRPRHPLEDAVRSEKVKLAIREHKLRTATLPYEKRAAAKELNALLDHYAKTDELFKGIVNALRHSQNAADKTSLKFHEDDSYASVVHQRKPITQWDCYQGAVDALMFACPGLQLPQNDYALRHLYMVVNLCEMGHPSLAVRTAIGAASFDNSQFCDTVM
nr:hypothetical protein BaRGS_008424 [Batillaria attramentaria]